MPTVNVRRKAGSIARLWNQEIRLFPVLNAFPLRYQPPCYHSLSAIIFIAHYTHFLFKYCPLPSPIITHPSYSNPSTVNSSTVLILCPVVVLSLYSMNYRLMSYFRPTYQTNSILPHLPLFLLEARFRGYMSLPYCSFDENSVDGSS